MNVEQTDELLEETSDEEEGFSDLDTTDEEAMLIKGHPASRGGGLNEGSIISNLAYFRNRGFRSPQHRSPNSDDILALLESGGEKINGGSIYSEDSGKY